MECPGRALATHHKYRTRCARDDLEYTWTKQVFSEVFAVALYAEQDQIRSVRFGDFEDLARWCSTLDNADRLRPELRSKRDQLPECMQHCRYIACILDRMQQNELCAMLLGE